MTEISNEELNERVAILRKLRSLLELQRNKFREYLNVLEKQQDSITTENSAALFEHTELEKDVVSSIANLQKVIVPMSEMYKAANIASSTAQDQDVAALQSDLNSLQEKVMAQNAKNRQLLRTHMTEIKNKIENFKNPYRNVQSVYAKKTATGALVEVNA